MNPQEFLSWLDAPDSVLVMGVINVTPDSFSDGGLLLDPLRAGEVAVEMAAVGADIIDVGGESTRPGAEPVSVEEQIRRVVPAIKAIRKRSSIAISVDTTKAAVAEAALDAGADLMNDVSAGRDDPEIFILAAQRRAAIILMHRIGTPKTMQSSAHYNDVTGEIRNFLLERLAAAVAAGIPANRVLLDPGIGFGKTHQHDLTILHDLRQFASIGRPVVVGTSRKKFIGAVIGEAEPRKRIFGTAATVAWAVTNGAGVVRVHDVGAMSQVVRMTRAIADVK